MRLRRGLYFACVDGVPGRSLRVALVIGTALNLINQGDSLFTASPLNWWKFCLTFAMPYLVSTYGAVTFRLTQEKAAAHRHQESNP